MAQVPYTAILNQNTGTLTVYRVVSNKLEAVASATVFTDNTYSVVGCCDTKLASDNTIYVAAIYPWSATTKTYIKIYRLTVNGLNLDATYEIGASLDLKTIRWNPTSFDFAFTTTSYIYIYNYDPNTSTITSKTSVSVSNSGHVAWSSDGSRLVTSSPSSHVKSYAWDGESLVQKCSVSLSSYNTCYYPYFVPDSNTDIVFYYRYSLSTPNTYKLKRHTLNEETGNSWTLVYELTGQDSGGGYRPIFLILDAKNQYLYLVLIPESNNYTYALTTDVIHVYQFNNDGISFIRSFNSGVGSNNDYYSGSAFSTGVLLTQYFHVYNSTYSPTPFIISNSAGVCFSNDMMRKVHYLHTGDPLKRIVPKHADYKRNLSFIITGFNDEMFVGADDADTPMYVFRGIPGNDDSWTKYTLQSGTGKANVHHNLAGAVFASTWASSAGKVYIWDATNEEWDDVGLTTSYEISSVCGTSASSLWVSMNDTIYYWDGGTLTSQKSTSGTVLFSYWSDSLILGMPSINVYTNLYRWDGNSWGTQSFSSYDLSKNAYTTNGTVWWIGIIRSSTPRYLSLYRSTNGGASWTEYRISNYYNFRDYPSMASTYIEHVFSTDADTCYFTYVSGLYKFDRTTTTVTPEYTFPQGILFSAQGTMLDEINTEVGYIGRYSLSSWVTRTESAGAGLTQDGGILGEHQFSIGGLLRK